eukprot:200743_1
MTTDKQSLQNALIQKENDPLKHDHTFAYAETPFEEFMIILRTAVPIILCNLCEYVPQWISYYFIGHLPNSTTLLASTGLSMTFTNCIGISITFGMTKSLDTLIPQALGQQNEAPHIKKRRLTIYFQQSVMITYIILIPILIAMYFAGDILCYIGQQQVLREYINNYCRALIPLVIAMLWFSILCRLIRNLNLNDYSMYITIFSGLSAYPLNYLFIIYLKYNYIYTAISMDICMIQIALLTTLLLIYKGYYYLFIPMPLKEIFNKNGIKTYLYMSVPTLITNASDWWISEIIALLSGYVYSPFVAVASSTIGNTLDAICCEINYSAAYPLSIRIGRYVGMGSQKLAKRAMFMGLIVTTIMMVMISVTLLLLKDILPYIWISNNNKEVGYLSSNLIYFVCLRQLFYNIFGALSSIYIGLGNQKYIATISIMCHFCIGFVLSVFILFYFNLKSNLYYGLYSIWFFNSMGYASSSLILFAMLATGFVSWDKVIHEAKSRLQQNKNE